MKRHHHGNIATSKRLQSVLKVLEDHEWHTSLEIATKGRTTAPGASVNDLRGNGLNIETRYAGRSAEGRKVYEYRLIPEVGQISLGI